MLNGVARTLSIYNQTLLHLTALHYAIFKATLDTLTQAERIDPCKIMLWLILPSVQFVLFNHFCFILIIVHYHAQVRKKNKI